MLCGVSLALKRNVTRKESWFAIITSISAFRRSNRGGRTCSTRKMRSVGSIADDFQVIFSGHISCPFAGRSVLGPHVSCARRDNMYMLRSPTVAWSPGVSRVLLRSKICLGKEPSKFCLGPVIGPDSGESPRFDPWLLARFVMMLIGRPLTRSFRPCVLYSPPLG